VSRPTRGKESVASRWELLRTVGLGGFNVESARSEFMAQLLDIKKPDFVKFVAAPVIVATAAKYFYIPDQRSCDLAFRCFNQHGPILARSPSSAGERRLAKSNYVKDEDTTGRQRSPNAFEEMADNAVCTGSLCVISQRLADRNNRVVAFNFDLVRRSRYEVRRRNPGAGAFEQFSGGVDSRDFEPRIDERLCQWSRATADIEHTLHPERGAAKAL
jgi:hypothetical protein